MTDMPKSLNDRNFFLLSIGLLISADVAILLNIPFLRQIIGFFFLTILPGLLILQILKLNKLELTERFVLSVGLSISFLMFFGLLINNLLLGFGYETPLSTIPLLISFNLAFIVLAIIGYKTNKDSIFSLPNLNLSTSEKAFLFAPILFPALSIFGMHVMNATDNNIVLMSLLFLITIYVVFVCLFNHKFSKRLYPVVIFLICISLLLMYSLRSNYIIGSDVHLEYYFFQATLDNLHWSTLGLGSVDCCLSISLLPSIYQTFLNINLEYIFKILYSLIFSISPLVIYLLSKKYIGNLYAFLASAFFMSQIQFLWTLSYARVNTGVLFFALAIMVLFHDGMSELYKKILFIVFISSLIVSYYSVSYITFFVLLLTWIGMQILSMMRARKKKLVSPSEDLLPLSLEEVSSPNKRNITIISVILFFAILFYWYSQVTEVPFKVGMCFLRETFRSFNEIFLLESRGAVTQSAFGETYPDMGTPQKIEFVFTWLTILFIAIGVIFTIIRFRELSISIPNLERSKFEEEFLVISLVCCALIVADAAMPHISKYYGGTRTYFQATVILSMFFIIGGVVVAKYLKLRPYLVILMVLLPYFLCTTGTMYQVFDVPKAITLNSPNSGGPPVIFSMYIYDQESYAAKWLGKHIGGTASVYTGSWARLLVSQAGIKAYKIKSFIPYEQGEEIDGYIYLRYMDIVDGLELKYPHGFEDKGRIYNNGGSEIYK